MPRLESLIAKCFRPDGEQLDNRQLHVAHFHLLERDAILSDMLKAGFPNEGDVACVRSLEPP